MLLLSEPAAALDSSEDRNSPALASFSLEICTGFPDPVENRLGVLLLSEPAAALELDPEDRNSPALASFSLKYAQAFLILWKKIAERPTVDEREFIKVEEVGSDEWRCSIFQRYSIHRNHVRHLL